MSFVVFFFHPRLTYSNSKLSYHSCHYSTDLTTYNAMSQQSYSPYLMVTSKTLCRPHFLKSGVSIQTVFRGEGRAGLLYEAYTKDGHTAQQQVEVDKADSDPEDPLYHDQMERARRAKSHYWNQWKDSKCTLHLPSGEHKLPKSFALDVDDKGQLSTTSEAGVSNFGSIFYPTEKDKEDGQGGEGQERTETGTKTEGGVV